MSPQKKQNINKEIGASFTKMGAIKKLSFLLIFLVLIGSVYSYSFKIDNLLDPTEIFFFINATTGFIGIGTDTPTGTLDLDQNRILNVGTPIANGDAANKAYVDIKAGGATWEGYTNTTYTARLDGVYGGHVKCNSEYPGSRWASYEDIAGMGTDYPNTEDPWVREAVEAYDGTFVQTKSGDKYAYSLNPHCEGWKYGLNESFEAQFIPGHNFPMFNTVETTAEWWGDTFDHGSDGDVDLIFGTGDGMVDFYENTGNSSFPIFVHKDTDYYNNDFGGRFELDYVDLNGDGVLDIIEGDDDSDTVDFFPNLGTNENPILGTEQTNIFGYTSNVPSTEFVDMDNDGDLDAYALMVMNPGTGWTGSHHYLRYYENVGNSTHFNFTWASTGSNQVGALGRHPWGGHMIVEDIDNDDDYDLIIGAYQTRNHLLLNVGDKFNPDLVWVTGRFLSDGLYKAGFNQNQHNKPLNLHDYDGDGNRELIMLGNSEIFWKVFEETGNTYNLNHRFGLAHRNFSGNDVGSGAKPAMGDMDGDGDIDMVLGQNNGYLNYYENIGDATNPIMNLTSTDYVGLDVGSNSRPALGDIDNDGDLDLFVGEAAANALNYFKNTGNSTDASWTFVTATYLNISHGGSYINPALVDLDNDGDLDIATGQYWWSHLWYYENEGTPTNPDFNITPSFNVLDNSEYNVVQHTNPSFVDLDTDGDYDLFVANHNYAELKYYRNDGTPSSPNFVLITEDYFNWTQITEPLSRPYTLYGANGNYNYLAPDFADMNNDSQPDLIMGHNDGVVDYYRNIGNITIPEFKRINDYPFSKFAVTGYSNPAVGDIDRDGDLDLITGGSDGYVELRINIGNSTHPVWFLNDTDIHHGYNTWVYPGLDLVDMDNDGDLDLYRGQQTSWHYVVRNDGNATHPPDTFTAWLFGNHNNHGAGYLMPSMVDIDNDGDYDMFSGGDNGLVYFYLNIGSPSAPTFDTVQSNIFGFDVGSRAAPELFDYDNDGDYDAFIGNALGTIHYFRNDGTPEIAAFKKISENLIGDWGAYTAPAMGDFDGDGDEDMVLGTSGGTLYYFTNIVNYEYKGTIFDSSVGGVNVVTCNGKRPLACVS